MCAGHDTMRFDRTLKNDYALSQGRGLLPAEERLGIDPHVSVSSLLSIMKAYVVQCLVPRARF